MTEHFTCTWMREMTNAEYSERAEYGWFAESPSDLIVECGAPAVADARGWRCEAGHEHVTAEARAAEGWDYFDDDEIAGARHVPRPVEMRDMQGRPVR